jgi:hypothetical protein
MANNNSVTWKGASGKVYTYWIYSIPASTTTLQVAPVAFGYAFQFDAYRV